MNLIQITRSSLLFLSCLLAVGQSLSLAEPFMGREKHVSREITDYIGWHWQEHFIYWDLDFPEKEKVRPDSLVVESDGELVPSQLSHLKIKRGRLLACRVHLQASVPSLKRKVWRIWYSRKKQPTPAMASEIKVDAGKDQIVIANSKVSLKLLAGKWQGEMPGRDCPGPVVGIQSIKAEGPFQCRSGFRTDQAVLEWKARVVEQGPLFVDYLAEFRFQTAPKERQHPMVARKPEQGAFYTFRLRLYAGKEHALIQEDYGGLARNDSFFISFSDGFQPTSSNAVRENSSEKTYRIQRPEKPHTFFIIPCWHVNADYNGPRTDWFGFYNETDKDYLGIFRIDGNQWKYPVFNTVRAVDSKDGVRAEFPIMAGHRRWGLFAGTKDENIGRMSYNWRAFPRVKKARIHQAIQRESEFPLQIVKDWILGHGEPGEPVPLTMRMPIRPVNRVLHNGFSDNETAPPALVRFMREFLLKYRGKFLDEKNKTTDALILFWAYTMWDEEYYEWRRFHLSYGDPESIKHLYGKGVPNFNTDRYSCVAFAALALPDHPLAAEFIKHGKEQMNLQFREFFYESGVYQEGGDYYAHVLNLFADMFRIYKDSFGIDLFSSREGYLPRFKKTFAAFCNLQFPSGRMPVMGDGGMGANPSHGLASCAKTAPYYEATDPQFAEHLRWCANRWFKKPGGKPLPMESINLDPTGLVFRADFNTPRETMLLFRVGPTWSHWHMDQGQVQGEILGGKAAPVRSTCSGAHNHIAARSPHQTIAIGGEVPQGGNVERFDTSDFADLGIGRIHSRDRKSSVRRHVLFLRNDCFLIYDQLNSSKPSHFQSEGFDPKYFRFIDGGGTDRALGKPYRSILDWTGRKTEILEGGRCILVTKDDERDFCFMLDKAGKVSVKGVEFEGRYGVIRMKPGRIEFALFDGARAAAGGVEVSAGSQSGLVRGRLDVKKKLSVAVATAGPVVSTKFQIDGKDRAFSPMRNGAGFDAEKGQREFTLQFLPQKWEHRSSPNLWAVARTQITNTSARITWTSDQPGDSVVEYGTSPKLGSTTSSGKKHARIHEVHLKNLPAGQKIFFRVKTRGWEGRTATLSGEPFVTRKPQRQAMPARPFTIRFGAQGSSLDREKGLGSQSTRIEIAWDHLFSERGRFDRARLEELADRVASTRRAGIEPIVLLTYCHDWAQTLTDRQATWFHPFFGPPDHIADWKDFIRPVIERLKGQVQWYEIWNEPDGHYLANHTDPGSNTIFGKPAAEADPEFHDNTRYWLQDRYVPLVMATREIADEVDPKIRLMAPSWNHDYHGTRAELCFEAGLHNYIDAYSFHAYVGPPQNYPRWSHWTYDTYFKHIDRVFKKFDVQFPLAVTEWGFQTGAAQQRQWDFRSENDHAAQIAKAMLSQAATGRIFHSVLYRLDGGEFGLTESSSSARPKGKLRIRPRPSYRVFKALAELLGNTPLVKSRLVTIEPDKSMRWLALDLTASKQTLIALWPTGWNEGKMAFAAQPSLKISVQAELPRRSKVRRITMFGGSKKPSRLRWEDKKWMWEVNPDPFPGQQDVPPEIFVVEH